MLATKFQEEIGFINRKNVRFFRNSHFQYAVNIPAERLNQFEHHLLSVIDYKLWIDYATEYNPYVTIVVNFIED